MTEAGVDPIITLPEVPPDWVWVLDLPRCLAAWYGLKAGTVAADVADALWSGELRFHHRIVGVRPHKKRLRGYEERKSWPAGLIETDSSLMILDDRWGGGFLSLEGSRVVALDWTAADVDRRKGTVGGWPAEGSRPRHLIELPWAALRAWADSRAERWKMQERTDSPATLAAPASGTPAIGPSQMGVALGGAPRTYDRAAFVREVIREANEGGFETRAKMAAHMRNYIAENWEKQPDPETIRRWLKELYPDDLPP